MMGINFYDTVGGKRFIEGTIPKGIRAIEKLTEAVEELSKKLSSEKESVETPLMQVCLQEAEFLLEEECENDEAFDYTDEDVRKLASEFYDSSERWYDMEILREIRRDYLNGK